MKKSRKGILKRIWIISIILLILLAIMPTPNNVVTGNTTINMELKPGWNLEIMPKSISASDIALKSNYITSIVHKSPDGIYETFIPAIGVTDFNCEQNELIYIYSEAYTTLIFIISTLTGYDAEDITVLGDLDITGDSIFGKNLTVKGNMSVFGNIEVNSLNVTENLLVDGNLTVNDDLIIGKNLSINGTLKVGNNFSSLEGGGGRSDMISAVIYLIIEENVIVEKNLTVDENLIVGENLTVNENLLVDKDLTVDENLMVGKDLTVNENLIVGKDLIVGNLTITEDMNYGGNLNVIKDLTVGGNIIVNGNMDIGGELTIGSDLTVTGDIIGATGRSSTFVVAAVDSSALAKVQADYVCDGTADEVEIQAAIDALPSGGGTVALLEGNYSARQIYLRDYTRLVGQGYGTILRLPDYVTEAQADENGWHGGAVIGVELSRGHIDYASVENLQIDGNKANQDVDGTWAGRYGFMGVFFDDISYSKVINCYIYDTSTAGIYVEPVKGTAYYNQIVGNIVENCGTSTVAFGGIYTEVAYYTLIENNIVRNSYNHGIRADRNTFVIGNYVESSSIGAGIYSDGNYNVISNNIVRNTSILLLHAKHNIVSNNDCDDEIRLTRLSVGQGSEFNTIIGNRCPRIALSYESNYNTVDGNVITDGNTHGISLASASHNIVSNNIIAGNSQLTDNAYDGIYISGGAETIGSDYNHIHHNTVRHLGGAKQHRFGIYVTAFYATQTGNIVEYNDLRDSGKMKNFLDHGVGTQYYVSHQELFMDVIAGTADHIIADEDLTQATPITCTMANQPDVPRNINITITDDDTSITAFTIYVNGINALGSSASEVFVFSGGLVQTGNIAFATITSIQVSDITGDGAGDLLNVGIGTKLGLVDVIYESGDIYKVKKNTADYPSASYTLDYTYHTIDVGTVGAISDGDDFTIYYRSNLNFV